MPFTAPAPVHPTIFATLEAKAVHMAATILAFEQSSPPLMNLAIQAGEEEILSLCPGLAPFMPQVLSAMTELRPFLDQLLAQLKLVEQIPIQPAS